MATSKIKTAEVAERQAKLIRYRRQGVPFEDPRILGLGYTSRGAATKDFYRALGKRRDEQAAEVSAYRQEENERLDALLAAAWPMATELRPVFNKDGEEVAQSIDLKAVDTVLKLMDRRAKLNGLDMPVKAELSGPAGGAMQLESPSIAYLRDLIRTAGDPDNEADDAQDEADSEDTEDDGNGS